MPAIKDNPYAVSQAELVVADRSSANAFVEKWPARQLRALGWLAVIYAVARFIDLFCNTLRIFIEAPPQAYILWPSIIAAILNCYLLFYALRLFDSRFVISRRFRWLTYLMMVLPFLIESGKILINDKLESTLVLFSMDGAVLTYLGLVIFVGIVNFFFGIALLRIRDHYYCMKVLGWFIVITAVLIVSVVLIPLTLLTTLVLGIAFARIFFRAAEEIEALAPASCPS